MRYNSWARKVRAYLFIFLGVFSVFCLPESVQERLRGRCVNFYVSHFSRSWKGEAPKLLVLQTENEQLKQELESSKALLRTLCSDKHPSTALEKFLQPYFNSSIEGRVVFRDPNHWGSSLWINVGETSGIKRNSPVVCGRFLVGLVDYVGAEQSRVRLITDVGMKPSVSSVRGAMRTRVIRELAQKLVVSIETLPKQSIGGEEKDNFIRLILEFSKSIDLGEDEKIFRGILVGSGSPLWVKNFDILKGEGFHSSAPLCRDKLQPGDILVTTGMDGIFPPGLFVAEVLDVAPFREGASTFSLTAKPLSSDLETLEWVSVLSPMTFNPNDRPDVFGVLWD